jgi:hypothetical protein
MAFSKRACALAFAGVVDFALVPCGVRTLHLPFRHLIFAGINSRSLALAIALGATLVPVPALRILLILPAPKAGASPMQDIGVGTMLRYSCDRFDVVELKLPVSSEQ